jgi:hypothetical protein
MTVREEHDQGPGVRRSAAGLVVVVGFATALVVALGVVLANGPAWLTGGAAAAAVAVRPLPGERGSAELRRLATQVAALPDDVGSGRYALLKTETWGDREPRPGTDGEVPDGVNVPYHEKRIEWFADDYSGRWIVDTTPGGGAAEHDDAVEPADEGAAELDRRFHALPTGDGAYAASVKAEVDGVLPWFAGGDSGDRKDVARYLKKHQDPGPLLSLMVVSWQFAASDDDRHQPRTPRERAAVLRYLATVPGAVVTDGVKDPAGRVGIAVTVNAPAGLPAGAQSVTLLFDRRTGNLLASRSSFRPVETPLTEVRYSYPEDRVVLVRTTRFTDHLG